MFSDDGGAANGAFSGPILNGQKLYSNEIPIQSPIPQKIARNHYIFAQTWS